VRSLEELYTVNGILQDFNADGLPDALGGRVILRPNSSMSEKKVAINICARIGFETTGLDLPFAEVADVPGLPGSNIYIQLDGENGDTTKAIIELIKDETDNSLLLKSSSRKALEHAGEYLYTRFPHVWEVGDGALKFQDLKADISASLPAAKISLIRLVVDERYEGIYSCVFSISVKNLDEAANYINNHKDKFKWRFVGQTEFLLDDGTRQTSIVVQGAPLGERNAIAGDVAAASGRKKVSRVDISNPYDTGSLLEDRDGDFLSDFVASRIIIPDEADDYELVAACNVAARLGLETLGIAFPVAFSEREFKPGIRNPIVIGGAARRYLKDKGQAEPDDEGRIKLFYEDGNNIILILGKGQALTQASLCFSQLLPHLDEDRNVTLTELKQTLRETLEGRNFDGQVVIMAEQLKTLKEPFGKSVECYFEKDETSGQKEKIEEYFKSKFGLKQMKIHSYKDKQTVWERHYQIPWEVDKFKEILDKKVYPKIKKGDRVVITGLLSEEKQVRDKLKKTIKRTLEQKGALIEKLDIYCSYKQGLSWIMEDVVPRIKEIGPDNGIGEIVIRFRKFVREGKNEWEDIDGAQPSYSAHGNDDKWFDLPIRWLQEIYPVDDLLSNELGIEREKVRFEALEDDSDATYEITVKDSQGIDILRTEYRAKYSERPYLDEYPEIGRVHPSTGWITVRINGQPVVDENIKTDLEEIWDIYQGEILRKCKEYMLERTQGSPSMENQPFFKELKMEILASEPDYDLSIREDRVSALDALHEDLYFVALDLFKTFGERNIGKALSEPGLILPCIEKRNGMPASMKVLLSSEKFETPRFYVENGLYEINTLEGCEVWFSGINVEDGGIRELEVEVVAGDRFERMLSFLEAMCELHGAGLINIAHGLKLGSLKKVRINLKGEDRQICFEIEVRKDETDVCREGRRDVIRLLETFKDKVIGYNDYLGIIESLKNLPEVRVWKAGESYQGRSIYAVDIISRFKTNLVSRAKLLNYKPTYMIVNRHHANEVSSTNSCFILIQRFISDEKYRKYLKKVNLTVIPVENVDGCYIHGELQKQNPKWKLHVARFNAVGKEFANDYWKDTKYGEAKAVPRVWRKWLPDIVVDNHGVPSHEWDQQFSGYVSPWYRGFWIPKGIFYGIFYYLDEPGFEYQRKIFEHMQEKVAQWLNKDNEIVKWQEDWKDRFEKYASRWMPRMFPANYYKNLIFYWIPCKRTNSQRHPAHRYPAITAVDWITEVSDETAQGDYLRLCSKAHHIADMALIDLISKASLQINDLSTEDDGVVTLKKIRKRPLMVNELMID